MGVKHELYYSTKKIFDDLRHLKHGYGGVSWTEHKTNEEVLQMVETEREIMDTIRSRQKRLGHILRHDMTHYCEQR